MPYYDDILEFEPNLDGSDLRIGIVMSRFNADIGEGLLGGGKSEFHVHALRSEGCGMRRPWPERATLHTTGRFTSGPCAVDGSAAAAEPEPTAAIRIPVSAAVVAGPWPGHSRVRRASGPGALPLRARSRPPGPAPRAA